MARRLNKTQARNERNAKKAASAREISHSGVVVTKAEVKNQRYLREHGQRHSPRVADVFIGR